MDTYTGKMAEVALSKLNNFLNASFLNYPQDERLIREELKRIRRTGEDLILCIGDKHEYAILNNVLLYFRTSESRHKVPSVIEGVPIKRIGAGAYYRNLLIRTIEVSEGIESIGRRAFYRNDRLLQVTLPYTVTSIDSGAFEECRELLDFQYYGRVKESIFEDVKSSGYDLVDGRTLIDPVILGKDALLPADRAFGVDSIRFARVNSDVGIIYNTYRGTHPDRKIIKFRNTEEGESLEDVAQNTKVYLRRDLSIKIKNGFSPFWLYANIDKYMDEDTALRLSERPNVALMFIDHSDRRIVDGKMCINIQITRGVYFFSCPIKVVVDGDEYYVGTKVYLNADSRKPYLLARKPSGVFDRKGCKQTDDIDEKVIDKYNFIFNLL